VCWRPSARCGTSRPQPSFRRTNYGDISVTVLRPVHVGDSRTSVLLNRAGRGVDDMGIVVGSMCRGWGSTRTVHVAVKSCGNCKQVSHRRIHSRCCDSWGNRGRSFLEICARTRGKALRLALGPLPNPGREFLDVIEHFASLGHLGEDFALGVHDRGVVAAECLSDLRQRQVGQFAAQVHRDLA
jgi:hypothetical protein